jgi:hypothetical protein
MAHLAPSSVGAGRSFARGKAAGPEADHVRPYSVEVKTGWSYGCTHPIFLHGMYEVKFSFTFTCIFIAFITTKYKYHGHFIPYAESCEM